jgi:hypothetical protein
VEYIPLPERTSPYRQESDPLFDRYTKLVQEANINPQIPLYNNRQKEQATAWAEDFLTREDRSLLKSGRINSFLDEISSSSDLGSRSSRKLALPLLANKTAENIHQIEETNPKHSEIEESNQRLAIEREQAKLIEDQELEAGKIQKKKVEEEKEKIRLEEDRRIEGQRFAAQQELQKEREKKAELERLLEIERLKEKERIEAEEKVKVEALKGVIALEQDPVLQKYMAMVNEKRGVSNQVNAVYLTTFRLGPLLPSSRNRIKVYQIANLVQEPLTTKSGNLYLLT